MVRVDDRFELYPAFMWQPKNIKVPSHTGEVVSIHHGRYARVLFSGGAVECFFLRDLEKAPRVRRN